MTNAAAIVSATNGDASLREAVHIKPIRWRVATFESTQEMWRGDR